MKAIRSPRRSSSARGEVAVPTVLSTICICIVFVPVFLLQGTAKYLFSPLSLSVCVSLIASLALSFTLVPVLFASLMRSSVEGHAEPAQRTAARDARGSIFSARSITVSRRVSTACATAIATASPFAWRARASPACSSLLLIACSLLLFPQLGRDFFPQVDAGQMRLHVRAPPASRIEETQRYFAEVETAIRQIVGSDQIDVILDNIGLPYSGINIALSDSATVGPMDGEILISLKKKHTPDGGSCRGVAARIAEAVSRSAVLLPARGYRQSGAEFRPARADRCPDLRTGRATTAYALAQKIARDLNAIPGVVDSHVFQVPDAPALTIDVDRTLAKQLGVSEDEVAQERAGDDQFKRADRSQFLGRSAKQRELSAGRPDADLSGEFDRRTLAIMPVTAAGGKSSQMLIEFCRIRTQECAPCRFAAQHPAGLRRQCRRSGPRPRFRRGRHRQGAWRQNGPRRPRRSR